MKTLQKGDMILFVDEYSVRNDVWTEGFVVSYQDKPDNDGVEGYYVVRDNDGNEFKVTDDPHYIQQRCFGYFSDGEKLAGHGTFSYALDCLKHGYRVSREGWNGKGMFLVMIHNAKDDEGKVIEPFVAIFNAQGVFSAWNSSQSDLMAEDWFVTANK